MVSCVAKHVIGHICRALFAITCAFSPLCSAEPRSVAGEVARNSARPEEIAFALRSINTRDGHWYANFGYYAHGPHESAAGDSGRLCRLNLKTGAVTVLLDDPDGAIRDPQVHYSGEKILFSYRKGGRPDFDLYEIGVDGTALTQITSDQWDDIEPTYLPDGGIAFCSSRCMRWVPCYVTQVAIMHRCEADGSNIRALSANAEQENHPWMLPDGRLLYTRWEYTDRSNMHYHHLWTMNPDGTQQMTYYGNQNPGRLFIDAKPIPGSQRVVLIDSPKHGRREHFGDLAVLDPSLGPDDESAMTTILAGEFRDPYPISQTEFLAAEGPALYIIDINGGRRKIYDVPEKLIAKDVWVHEPRPIAARPRERVIASQVDLAKDTGSIVVMDAYQGRNMDGVDRGAIKEFLVLENLPLPTGFSGGMEPVTWGASYFLNRILGTVPVEEDGSVHAEIPANRAIQLVALDADGFSVKRMHSFLTVMPGETATCIGCHDDRKEAGLQVPPTLALSRRPSKIKPIEGMPEIFDYPRDIQPIWDKHCLDCHDVDKRAGGVLMTGDEGPVFMHSYFSLSSRLQMADGRNLARSNYPPYRMGSAASYLINKIDGSHHGVHVSPHELRKIKLWIDASATYAGTYAALGSGLFGSEMPSYEKFPKTWLTREAEWPSVQAAKKVFARRCNECHQGDMRLPQSPSDHLGLRIHHMPFYGKDEWHWTPPWLREDNMLRPGSEEWAKEYLDPRNIYSHEILYNLSRPEKSVLLLAPLAKSGGGYGACGKAVFQDTADPDFQAILTPIEEAKVEMERLTRFNMPGFRPHPDYIREMIRYGVLPATHAIGDPIDVYEIDQKYWAVFHPSPGT